MTSATMDHEAAAALANAIVGRPIATTSAAAVDDALEHKAAESAATALPRLSIAMTSAASEIEVAEAAVGGR